jgi:hypothetical protein
MKWETFAFSGNQARPINSKPINVNTSRTQKVIIIQDKSSPHRNYKPSKEIQFKRVYLQQLDKTKPLQAKLAQTRPGPLDWQLLYINLLDQLADGLAVQASGASGPNTDLLPI